MLLQRLQSLNPPVFFRRQIALKRKTLPVCPRSHQRQQQAGRPHQRPHLKPARVGQRHQIRPGVRHRRTTRLADNSHAPALLQRPEQIGQRLQIGVFVQRLQIQFPYRRGYAQMFQMQARGFLRLDHKISQPRNLYLLMRQQAGGIGRTQRGGYQIKYRIHSISSKAV